MKWIVGSILAVFFLLEIVAMIAFGYYGYHLKSGIAVKIILAVALPLAVAILWGVFLSPKASIPVFSFPVRTALKFVVFVLASASLYAAEQKVFGLTLFMVSFLIVAIVFILKLHEVKM
ncbi:YrdB family protein [Cohnella sp. LGH]|uniref:YrdB family protein n=1 Tax=Cohnella sp. LGH TaxID=1619153 RepID=UPI001FFE1A43|nr:YrdB family protein [Cohnella sp. LGH]